MKSAGGEPLLCELFRRLRESPEYELLLDAVYYWALCLGSSGAERSFCLRYGRPDVYARVQILIKSLLGETPSVETINALLDQVEQLLPQSLTLDVMTRVDRLDFTTRRVLSIIGRMRIYEGLRRDSEFVLEYSIAINNIVRRLLNNKVSLILSILNKIISTGLLISCAWAPYEGLPHLYLVPKYSLPVWEKISSQ